MSNRLYPTWKEIGELHNPLTAGEKALLLYLDEHLPRDPTWTPDKPLAHYGGWLIFAQPYFNGSRPDVVILNPSVGIVIYEVKDWNLDLYGKNGDEFYVKTGQNQTQRIQSPLKQARQYRQKLIGQLVPEIGEQFDKEKQNEESNGYNPSFALIKTAVYFHKSTTRKAQTLFGPKIKTGPNAPSEETQLEKFFKYEPVFGFDYLVGSHLAHIAPDAERSSSRYWHPKWNNEVLFWLRPPYHSIEQGKPLTLRGNQLKVAEPTPGHHRVRGVAGSGKTQALAYRAGKLASQGYNVLLISFNITLWHYVKDMIARAPFAFSWEKIRFIHFNGFCRESLSALNLPMPSFDDSKIREDYFREAVPSAVIHAILNNPTNAPALPKYDAILIDEGQDYHFEWYDMLTRHFLGSRDELLVVCDKKQNIYEREMDWLDKRVTRTGLDKFKEDYVDLKVSFRLPRSVAALTNEFSEAFNLNQDLRAVRPANNPVLIHSHHIVWLNIKLVASY